jgi:regulator of extracellular matrix RemA (YlzA/DUF370 family)
MKLLDILFENVAKEDYISSLKSTFSDPFSVSIKKEKNSDVIIIKVTGPKKRDVEEFEKLVNNNFIRNITSPTNSEVKRKIKDHDEKFAKKKRIKIKDNP